MTKISYNERSWAIDIITEINLYVSKNDRTIQRAGGETTINTGKQRLFPDVLLYGKNSEILMGWELKMPDTQITDKEFIENAVLKANILGLNSFLLWNVGMVVLYVKQDNAFQPLKTWNSLKSIATKREDVVDLKKEWKKLLHEVLKDLNNFFDDGEIEKKTFIESFKDSTIIDFILRNNKSVARDLQESARQDVKFSAEANIWWRVAKSDYPKQNQWEILSKIILVNWINKFLFAHILIAFFDPAKKVETIDVKTSVEDAINIFQQISAECNFWNIFQPQLGEKYLNDEVWSEIQQLNTLLNDIELSSVGQDLLQDLLQNIIYSSKRKIAGQYTTPMFLARLLTGLTMLNLEQSLHDPCCGTGTIARAAYDLKKESGIESKKALESIFSSDKVAFPLQMATIALTEPMNIGEIIQIFKEDCTKIAKGNKVEFKDPYTGKSVSKKYLGVDCIASNLPFIQQEDLKILNPNIEEDTAKIIKDYTKKDLKLNAKSDLFAYIPFYLWKILKTNGRLGVITSNSWLGTEWGESYRAILNKFFHIEYVIISGKGRWFQNSDIVTTILILNKRNSIGEIDSTEMTNFITIETDLQNKENRKIQEITENIIANISNENVKIRKYKTQNLFNFELNWGALFSNVSWLSEIQKKVIPVSTLFTINRGERRGWDPMFYPKNKHGIESEYIEPILKNSKEIENLTTAAESEAFCCSKSIKELKKLKHKGALNWIKKFEYEVNGKGKPLPVALKRGGYYWYEMNSSTMADLVASINFNKRIFIAKLDKKSFVNQRLTRFTAKNKDIDIDLAHALLNSTLGIFFIESIGFGRGLGALDLSSTRMKKDLYMLNPDLLSKKQIQAIKSKFSELNKRKIFPILEELENKDRQELDDLIFKTFGIHKYKDQIINSLKTLYKIRMNACS